MKIGCVGYATSRGLGHLMHDFYLNGVITDVLVINHPSVPGNSEWYPEAPCTDIRVLDTKLLKDFASKMDAMIFFETPYWWPIVDTCASLGIRTFLVTMYECTPPQHSKPYCYICPSLLDMEYFNKKG